MNQSERIGKLIFRYTRNELSTQEKTELDAWRNSNPSHEQAFLEETDPEQMRKNYIGMQENKEAVWKKLQERFPDMLISRSPNARIVCLTFRRIAAAAGIVLICGLYFLFRGPSSGQNTTDAVLLDPDGVETALDDFHRGMMDGFHGLMIKRNEQGMLEYTPPSDSTAALDRNYKLATRSGKLILNLVPGIRIWLNDSSSVTYPEDSHRDTLSVQVIGESYIEVNQSGSHPLVITVIKHGAGSPANLIMVSNAHINIIASKDSSLIQATQIEGTARIFLSEKVYSLQHGQHAIIKAGEIKVVNVTNPESFIQWLK